MYQSLTLFKNRILFFVRNVLVWVPFQKLQLSNDVFVEARSGKEIR